MKMAMKPFGAKVLTINKLLQEAYDRKKRREDSDSEDEGAYNTRQSHAVNRKRLIKQASQVKSLNNTLTADRSLSVIGPEGV